MTDDIQSLNKQIKDLNKQKRELQEEKKKDKYAERKTKEMRLMLHKIVPEGFTIEDTVDGFFDSVYSYYRDNYGSSDKELEAYQLGEFLNRVIKEFKETFEERQKSEKKFLDALASFREVLCHQK